MSVVSRGPSLALLLAVVLALPSAAFGDEPVASLESTPITPIPISTSAAKLDPQTYQEVTGKIDPRIQVHLDRGYNACGEGVYQRALLDANGRVEMNSWPQSRRDAAVEAARLELAQAEEAGNRGCYLATSIDPSSLSAVCELSCSKEEAIRNAPYGSGLVYRALASVVGASFSDKESCRTTCIEDLETAAEIYLDEPSGKCLRAVYDPLGLLVDDLCTDFTDFCIYLKTERTPTVWVENFVRWQLGK